MDEVRKYRLSYWCITFTLQRKEDTFKKSLHKWLLQAGRSVDTNIGFNNLLCPISLFLGGSFGSMGGFSTGSHQLPDTYNCIIFCQKNLNGQVQDCILWPSAHGFVVFPRFVKWFAWPTISLIFWACLNIFHTAWTTWTAETTLKLGLNSGHLCPNSWKAGY